MAETNYLVVDYLNLELPKPGDNTLHILSRRVLELKRINTKPQPPSTVDSWNWVDANGQLQNLPTPSQFTIRVNGAVSGITVVEVGFKRRPLYLRHLVRDMRIENCLILKLSQDLNENDVIEVTSSNPDAIPPGMRFVAKMDPLRYNPAIHVNQEGYVPGFPKKAMVGYFLGSLQGTLRELGEAANELPAVIEFSIVDQAGVQVFPVSGWLTMQLRADTGWNVNYENPPYQNVFEGDFDGLATPGLYRLKVRWLGASLPFLVDDGIAMGFARTYALGIYHQRCGTNNVSPFTRHTHGVCHTAPASIPLPEASYAWAWGLIGHLSSVENNDTTPPQTLPMYAEWAQLFPIIKRGNLDVSGGHHDAGDYSKYTHNLAAFIHYLAFAVDYIPNGASLDNLGIPESGDGLSDLLQEAKWEADMLAKLQDDDGGFFFLVYPRNRRYEDNVTPDNGDPQVVWPKTTGATAAAVGALANLAASPTFKKQFPAAAEYYRQKALAGWTFLLTAVGPPLGLVDSYQTITHYGKEFRHDDELAWAAAAMYVLTGNPECEGYLRAWFPDPEDQSTHNHTWWHMFGAYGYAIRSYVFAVLHNRVAPGEGNYLDKCRREVMKAGLDAYDWYNVMSYGTSYPTHSKGFGTYGVSSYHFATERAFDMVAAELLAWQANPDYLGAIVGNVNFEAGCNPVNVSFLTGMGYKRHRVIVHQHALNDNQILPPSGIPVGSIQMGFQSWPPYSTPCPEFGQCDEVDYDHLCYPSDEGEPRMPMYDRWGEAHHTYNEFMTPNMSRSLATAVYLATLTAPHTEPWQPVGATVTPVTGTIYSTIIPVITPSVAQPEMLQSTVNKVVVEVTGPEPNMEPRFQSFVPTKPGQYVVSAEAEWADGRRLFGSGAVAISNPNGGEPFPNPDPTGHTIALYSFNGSFNTSIGTYNLTPGGNVTRASGNALWMATPSGEVARFTSGGDTLTVTIPDTAIMPNAGQSLTIEAWIYPRSFLGLQDDFNDYFPISLYQDYDALMQVWDSVYGPPPPGPILRGPSDVVVTSGATWAANVQLNTWNFLQIVYDHTTGRMSNYVDGRLIGDQPVSMNYTHTGDWTFSLGQFDGDIDEVRISKTFRPVAGRKISIVATDPNATELGADTGHFTVFRSGPVDQAANVSFAVSGTASRVAPLDFTPLGTTISFLAGESAKTITVTPLQDTAVELNETVVVTLTAPAGYALGTASATVTISDQSVWVRASDSAAGEGATPNAGTFTVTRAGDIGSTLNFTFSLTGTATPFGASRDFNVSGTGVTFPGTSPNGTVSFAAGVATRTITITPINDASAENRETVIFNIFVANTHTGEPRSDTVTIQDDDNPAPTLSITANDPTATEPCTDTATFTVNRTGSTLQPLAVFYSIQGSLAISGQDYVPLSGSVTIPAGQPSAAIVVTPYNDSIAEGSETLVVTLVADASYVLPTPAPTATIIIQDNDTLSGYWETRASPPIGARVCHSTVFTGSDVIIWGGARADTFLRDGAIHNIASHNWTPVTTLYAPSGRWFHAAVWTGSGMIVWGGRTHFFPQYHFGDGGIFFPSAGWVGMNVVGAPSPRSQMSVVWTGTEMIIWGGTGDGFTEKADGARYHQGFNTWAPMAPAPAELEARFEHTAVWTGTEMIVFGGIKVDGYLENEVWTTFNNGARYNPANNTWTMLPNTPQAPASRSAHTAVWTGQEMLIWGGRTMPGSTYLNSGARYKPPPVNSWTPITVENAPQPRLSHAAAWTGNEMVIWGGYVDDSPLAVTAGAQYNPVCDSWTPTPLEDAPVGRFFGRPDCAVWTADGMFFYGGWGPYPDELNSVGFYRRNAQ